MSARFSRVGLVVCLLLLTLISGSAAAQVAIQADIVHTMNGSSIKDGVVIIGADGHIAKVGPASSTPVPPGYRVIRGAVATPGLVDARTVVGLAGALNQPHDQMQLETSTAMQPELRAVDAYNARDPLVEWLRSHGITTIHTGHGPGALISGQTMIAKTRGDEVDEAVIVPEAMIAATLGEGGLAAQGKSPGTRAKAIALLRAELLKAKDYASKQAGPADKRPSRDLHLEALARVTNREVPLLVTAHRVPDLLAALRVASEFGIKIVLDGASESYLVLEKIKAANVPVILHPTMARAAEETGNLSMETASVLKKAGILFAIESGYESYVPKTRVVLWEAALAAARGLTQDQALAAVTIDAARLLGVDKRVGSLEAGKDGDVAIFDGDPFEYTSHVVGVVIDGHIVSETPQ